MIAAEVIWDPGSVDGYEDVWNAVFRRRPHQPSVSFAWSRALLRHHVKASDSAVLVVLRDGEGPCGFVPLVIEPGHVVGLPFATVMPLSERYNTHGDLLLSSTDGDIVPVFVDALFELDARWDVFRMGRLLQGSALVESLEGAFARRRVPFRSRVEPPSFVLRLPASVDEYLAERSAKFRNFARRAEKKLAARGHVAFRLAGEGLDVEAAYRAVLDIEARSWKHGHGTAISAIEHQQGFYQQMSRDMAGAGALHLSLLFVDDRPVAYHLGVVFDGTYFCLKTSFDEAFRAWSPATVARVRLIADLIARGMSTFDFPGEPYEWEAQWASEVSWHRSLVVFNRSVRGRAWSVVHRLREAWRDRPPEGTIEYVDPKSLKGPDSP